MYRERKSIRLFNYDYSSEGIYFVTICTKNREPYFGKIDNTEIVLTEIGMVAQQYWAEIPRHFSHVKLDDFVVMPNHLHGILILDYSFVGTRHGVSLQSSSEDIVGPCHGMALQKPEKKYFQEINHF